MKTRLILSWTFAFSFLVSITPDHTQAEDVIRSAHDVQQLLIKETYQKLLLLDDGTERVLPNEILLGEIGGPLFNLLSHSDSELTLQKTSNGAIFKYFPGFPKTDPRHVLGPGWIYQGGLQRADADWVNPLKNLILHDHLRDKNNQILQMTAKDAHSKCPEKSRWLDSRDMRMIYDLGEKTFLDLSGASDEAVHFWNGRGELCAQVGFYSDRTMNFYTSSGLSVAVRCVSEI